MLVRTLVQQFFDNHLTAYHITGSVNQPNDYIWKKLTNLKEGEQYDVKKHADIIKSVKSEEDIVPIIKRYALNFDPRSKTTRNAVNIFYQFILLIQIRDNAEVGLEQAIANVDAAEKSMDDSKKVINAHVLTSQSISKNPLNIVKVFKKLDDNPFKDFFELVENDFRTRNDEKLICFGFRFRTTYKLWPLPSKLV